MKNNKPRFEDLDSITRSIELVVSRLERLSADSKYAHLASGYRGFMLRSLENLKAQPQLSMDEYIYFQKIIDSCYEILSSAAREIIR